MKLKNNLRNKILMYIFIFTAIMLLILWLFQVVFLDSFYKGIKTNQVKSVANDVVDRIEDDNLSDYIKEINTTSEYCVQAYQNKETQYGKGFVSMVEQDDVYSVGVCSLYMNDVDKMNKLIAKAYNNDGEVVSIIEEGDLKESIKKEFMNPDTNSGFEILSNSNFEGVTIGKVVEKDNGNTYFVAVNARVTPVAETVETIQQQFIYISGCLIAVAILIAIISSKKISAPIHKITKQAKKLAEGDLSVQFEGKGYIEIEELNETLNYAVQELSKVEKLRNELIANMSHDLRTPLTMIAGYSEAMRDLPEENTVENIQVIIDETQRLTTLVNSILDLSKIQANIESLHIESYNLTSQIKNIITRFNALLEKDDYHIEFTYDNDVFVEADELKISQVIYNIMGNAIHYTGDDHKIMIRQIVQEDVVRIEIEDTGKGIKEEDIPYVWDRYYNKNSNHKRQQIGTGLGLSIVKGILELHKAKYGIISKKGSGALFFFELPIIKK